MDSGSRLRIRRDLAFVRLRRQNSKNPADLLEAIEPSVLFQAALSCTNGNFSRLRWMSEVVAQQLEHFVTVSITEDFPADHEVLREVRVVRGQVDAAARPRNLEIPAFDVRQHLRIPDPPHSEIDRAAAEDRRKIVRPAALFRPALPKRMHVDVMSAKIPDDRGPESVRASTETDGEIHRGIDRPIGPGVESFGKIDGPRSLDE